MTEYREPGQGDPTTTGTGAVWTTRVPGTTVPSAVATSTAAPPTARSAAAPAGQWRTRLRLGFRYAGIAIALAFVVIAILIFAYRWVVPPTTTLILAQRLTGTTIERSWRPLERISPQLARAVIMSEDAGFCGHRGVDWKEIERVYEQSLEGGATGGGSTIAMQTIKNLFLWPSKSYVRKALEIPMTLVADRWWGKARMLEIYLNIAEWGPGIFGAEAAARAYFDKSAADLTENEAALLAVALPNPLARNAAEPAPRQRRMASVVQGRMRVAAKNVRCLARTPG